MLYSYKRVVLFTVIALQMYTTVSECKEACWWTGCQPKTWAVTGCKQYKRSEHKVRDCAGGSEYYCCPVDEDCWWTGCQLNTWAVKGCDNYNRTENQKTECEDGFKYQCCTERPQD